MPDNYSDTIRLARLIGLDYQYDAERRIVQRFANEWVPWRPLERWLDAEPVTEWCRANEHKLIHWQYPSPAEYCRAVLAAFDSPEPKATLPERLRHLAESLEGDDWEHPITAREDCLRAAEELERLAELAGRLAATEAGVRTERLLREGAWAEAARYRDAWLVELKRLRAELAEARTNESCAAELSAAELATARATNRRLNRRCQAAERMAREYRHAANYFRTVGQRIEQQADTAAWWLGRLRKTVRAAEAAESEE